MRTRFVPVFLTMALATPGARAGELHEKVAEILKPIAAGDARRAVARLFELAASADEDDRRLAREAVSWLGPQDRAIAPVLAGGLRHAKPEVRQCAADALGRVASSEMPVLQALANVMRDPEPRVRAAVARALGAAGAQSKAALQALVVMLSDKDASVRAEAVRVLGLLRREAKPALQNIANLMVDKDAKVRRAATRALGRIGDPAALGVLLQFARGAKEEAELEAAYAAFLDMGDAAKPAVRTLHGIVYGRKKDWTAIDAKGLAAIARIAGSAPQVADLAAMLAQEDKRQAAADALLRAGSVAAGAADALVKGLADRDPAFAAACARALGNAASGRTGAALRPKAVPALVKLLDHADDAVSAAALRALGDIGDASIAPELVKRAENYAGESQVWVRYALLRVRQDPAAQLGVLRNMGAEFWPLRCRAQAIVEYVEAGGRGLAVDDDY